MARCVYGVAELPDINEVWTDKETYPYACISKRLADNVYTVNFSNKQYYRKTSNDNLYTLTETKIRQYHLSGISWIFDYEFTVSSEYKIRSLSSYELIWGNYNILNEDGSDYFIASEPIYIDAPGFDYNSFILGITVGLSLKGECDKNSFVNMSDAFIKGIEVGIKLKKKRSLEAGLYESGSNHDKMIMSWVELLDRGIIDKEGCVIPGQESNLAGDLVLPNNLTSIPQKAYYDCDNLVNVKIPDSVTFIGEDAFYRCGSLESIKIPDKVTRIDHSAFGLCHKLKNVTFGPNSQLIEIGFYAFSNCNSLTNIEIPSKVQAIERSAFTSCGNLKTVTFGANSQLKWMGSNAFYECGSLTSIDFPEGVIEVGTGAFYNCDSLEVVNSFRTLDRWCEISFGDTWSNPVYYSDELEFNHKMLAGNIEIPNGAARIGSYCFERYNSITSVKIPDSVKIIGKEAFQWCGKLKNVTFGENSQLTRILKSAFSSCDLLNSISIPYGTVSIGDNAFDLCPSLSSVDIPVTVTLIGTHAFYRCESLTRINYGGTVSQWTDGTIALASGWALHADNYTVYCTDGTVSKDGTVTLY